MKKNVAMWAIALTVSFNAYAAESMLTPADISEEAQNTMYQHTMDYNQCMMQSRLEATNDRKSVQNAANEILMSCETHLDQLKAHLLDNDVNENLAIGITKKMRSRGARKLMTQSMNNLAAQASAVISAEKIKAGEAQ